MVSEQDLKEIAAQTEKVYSNAEYVGSLVTQGATGRPTEHAGEQNLLPGWWECFWERHRENTGMRAEETRQLLRKMRGEDWVPRTEEELAEAVKQSQALNALIGKTGKYTVRG